MGDPVEHGGGAPPGDLRPEYDARRDACPVVREGRDWLVLGHPEVVSVATDPETFSSSVTARRAIPNSLDGVEHAAYRAIVDRYLAKERVAALEPTCREIAASVVDALPRGTTVKTLAGIGVPYAVRAQSAWLGWPATLETRLVEWMRRNHAATRSGDRAHTAAVAEEFDDLIRGLLAERSGSPVEDVTGELAREEVDGRPLTQDEIVSILRNWTAGDLGSLATSIGVVVHFLAVAPEVQREVRSLVASRATDEVEAAVEEMLRIDDPFVSNRRRATRAVEVGGQRIAAGDRVYVHWTTANRDPRVFGDPDRYDPVGNADANLVFGIGPHVCPGRALTLMELRVVVEELLDRTTWLSPSEERPAVRETPPVGGWARVPVVLR